MMNIELYEPACFYPLRPENHAPSSAERLAVLMPKILITT